jgi:uncharacterized RDD family membrane protein YckC
MTTGDQDPNAFGQPSNFPPPTGDPYAAPPGSSYPAPPGGYPPPPGYAPPPQPGYGPPPGYAPPPPPAYQPPTNPYGAPGGIYPGGSPVGYGVPGSLWIRFAARFIDGLLVGIVSWVIAAILGLSSNILATGLFTGGLTFAYFVALEVTQGQTLGKKIFGLSVRGPLGAPKPDAKQSAIRNSWTLLSIVPYVGGLLSLIAMIWIAVTIEKSPTKQGKHDELAGGTQVIKS